MGVNSEVYNESKFSDFSTIVEFFEFAKSDVSDAVFVTNSHDVLNILICHRVVEIFGEDLLEVTWLDNDTFESIENAIGSKALSLVTAVLIPSQADDLFEEFIIKA